MAVDHDVSVEDLMEGWVNGNRNWVINNLSKRHPGIVATMITIGAQEDRLKLSDCNSITNMLMDNFEQVRDTKGLEFTCRAD